MSEVLNCIKMVVLHLLIDIKYKNLKWFDTLTQSPFPKIILLLPSAQYLNITNGQNDIPESTLGAATCSQIHLPFPQYHNRTEWVHYTRYKNCAIYDRSAGMLFPVTNAIRWAVFVCQKLFYTLYAVQIIFCVKFDTEI